MKALVYTHKMTTQMQDLSPPTIAAGQALVDIAYCGICGSDMHAWHGHDDRRIPPLVLGHEAVGTALTGQYAGKPVVINPLMSCGACAFCQTGYENLCPSREMIGMRLPGGFAEQIAIVETNLIPISDQLLLEDAALVEPLACSVNAVRLAVQRIPDTEAGIVILGGGAIGLLAAFVFKHYGYHHIWIAETSQPRRQMLEAMGDFHTYDPLAANPDLRAPDLKIIDIVIDAVGAGVTRAAASSMVRPGGVIVHIGLQDNMQGLDTRRITLQQISFVGSYCYSAREFTEALSLLEQGIVRGRGWAEIRPLADGVGAFQDIHNGIAPPKIILNTEI